MAFHPPTPETAARNAVRHQEARTRRRAHLVADLEAKAATDPTGPWAELLDELEPLTTTTTYEETPTRV